MSRAAPHAHGGPSPEAQRGAAHGYALVLSGGGARGFVHVGALRALECLGGPPSAIVGVSMGAIVGATYGLNTDWYRALVNMDVSGFPQVPDFSAGGIGSRLRSFYRAEQLLSWSWSGWGIGQASYDWGVGVLRGLTLGRNLEEARLPVRVTATDMDTGERVDLAEGPAWERLYASSALAGILPPAVIGGRRLIDGGYADIAPVDIARRLVDGPVIAIDASRSAYSLSPANGIQAMIRGLEICQNEHATLRFSRADLVLRPELDPPVDTLDFFAKRRGIGAGIRMVRANFAQISRLTVRGSIVGAKGSRKRRKVGSKVQPG